MFEQFLQILNNQRKFFDDGNTFNLQFRIRFLKELKRNIIKYEDELLNGLKKDLNRDLNVGYLTELKIVYHEIDAFIKNLYKWSKDTTCKPTLLLYHKKARISYAPRGQVYIVVPFNFPILLSLQPLAASVGAGNVTFVKMSYQTPNTNVVIKKIVEESFPHELVYLTDEKIDYTTLDQLSAYNWDFLFFTGSENTAAKIYAKQYMHFTPAVFELGGKSPMVVDQTANLKLAATKFLNAKLINSGQICVGVDYLILHEGIKDQFIKTVQNVYLNEASKKPYLSGALINEAKANEVNNFINAQNKENFDVLQTQNIKGYDELKLALIDYNKASNKEYLNSIELFSPLSYYYTFKNKADILSIIKQHPFPLVFYCFSKNVDFIDYLQKRTQSGAFVVDDTLVHVFDINLPFGGIKGSGLGSYHGKQSFLAFSISKPVLLPKPLLNKIIKEDKFFDGNYWGAKVIRKHK